MLAVCLGLAGALFAPADGMEIRWATVSGGSWNTAANWEPQNVPDQAGESALIPNDGFGYTVSINTSPTIDSLLILNPAATLSLGGAQTLTLLSPSGLVNHGIAGAISASGRINGNVHNRPGGRLRSNDNKTLTLGTLDLWNEGEISVNDNLGTLQSVLAFDGDALLHGPGTLVLHCQGGINDASLTTTAGVLTQAADHTLRGAGTVSAALDNLGTIRADDIGFALVLQTGDKSNSGAITAAAGANLDLSNCLLVQTGTGRLLADGGVVRLGTGARVVGGELASASGGHLLNAASAPILEDVHLTGELRVKTGTTLALQGTALTNDGLLTLNPELGSSNALVRVDSDLTLQGAGILRLAQAGDPNDAKLATAAGITLTHAAGHTVAGSGLISAQLVNEGLVLADGAARLLQLTGDPKTNRGVIKASSASTLKLSEVSLDQEAGATLEAEDGTVQLAGGVTITGGDLVTTGSGLILVSAGTNSLADLTLQGSFQVGDGNICVLRGTQITNDGTITLHPGATANNSLLRIDEDLVLQGNGDLLLHAPTGENDAGITGSGRLTLAADQTLRGSGEIHANVHNLGLIQADDPARRLVMTSSAKSNDAVLGAISGATLAISGIRLDQGPTGVLAPSQGVVTLSSGAVIAGGTLAPTGSGAVRVAGGSAYLEGAVNQGRLEVMGGDLCDIVGPEFINHGTVLINFPANANNAQLRFLEDATLAGNGEIVLQTASASSNDALLATAGAATLTIGPDQTVRGEGQITARLINQGTITADVSGKPLDLLSLPKTNQAVMRAENHGILRFVGESVTNAATLIAADSGLVSIAGGTLINDAEVAAQDGGRVLIDAGTLRNQALLHAAPNGRIDQTGGTLTSTGTLRADAGGEVVIDYGTFTNAGLVEAEEGGRFWCDRLSAHYSSGRLSQGTWLVHGAGVMRLIGAAVSILDAGVVLDGPQATIYRDEATTDALAGLTTLQCNGRFELMNGRDYATPGALANLEGTVVVGAGCDLTVGGTYTQTGFAPSSPQVPHIGWTVVNGTLAATSGLLDLQGGTLAGSGTVLASVTSAGRVDPGTGVGQLTIDGNYTQTADGTLYIDIDGSGAGEYDRLAVTGQAALAGRVWIRTAESAALQAGDTLTVMTCAAGTGLLPDLWGCPGVGLVYEAIVTPTAVLLVIHPDVSGVAEDPASGSGGEQEEPAAQLEGEGGPEPESTVAQALPATLHFSARPVAGGRAAFLFELPGRAAARLEVFDFSGRRMTEWSADLPAGVHRTLWDGATLEGCRAPTGVYFARAVLRTADGAQTRTARVWLVR